MAEGNLSVKNLSYLLSSFIKGAVAPVPGAAEERPRQDIRFVGDYQSFSSK